jgi:hypothetical protein
MKSSKLFLWFWRRIPRAATGSINNIETHYSFELPYLANPVFVINVYNIFGRRSQTFIEGQNQRSTNFVRRGILPIDSIQFTAFLLTNQYCIILITQAIQI